MGLLYQLEEELEKGVQEQLQQRLQEALDNYHPHTTPTAANAS